RDDETEEAMDEHPSDQDRRNADRECHEKAHLVSSRMKEATEGANEQADKNEADDVQHESLLPKGLTTIVLPAHARRQTRGCLPPGVEAHEVTLSGQRAAWPARAESSRIPAPEPPCPFPSSVRFRAP